MTPSEMETELSSLRARVLQLGDRERKRAEGWKSIHAIVKWGVILFALVVIGLLAYSVTNNGKGLEIAVAFFLVNISLISVAQTLMTGFALPDTSTED